MWFKLPDGMTNISVAQQHFKAEIKDDHGHGYFRAPPHFAGLLSMVKITATEPPEGADKDLPDVSPALDEAMDAMTKRAQALEAEVKNLREDNNSAMGQVSSLMRENDLLRKENIRLSKEVDALMDKLEDEGKDTEDDIRDKPSALLSPSQAVEQAAAAAKVKMQAQLSAKK